MKFKLIVVFIFCSHLTFSNSHLDSLFSEANKQYNSEMYAESIENYNTILDSNFISFELYFNLANSYYQFGKIPMSIYYYEKALKLRKDKDALNNLSLAKDRVTLIETIPQLFYVRWWNKLATQLPQKAWAVLLISFVWLTSVLLVLFFKNRKKWIFNSLVSSIIISIFMAALMYKANINENKKFGIVLKEAKLFNDNTNYQSNGSVDRGNKVLLLEKSSEMILVKLEDGQMGWVEKNRVKTLD